MGVKKQPGLTASMIKEGGLPIVIGRLGEERPGFQGPHPEAYSGRVVLMRGARRCQARLS